MQTLTQYEYLDRDMILKGVVEWIVKESPFIGKLPFKAIQGNSFKYNVELTLPTASWLTVGDTITESTGTYAQRTTDIYTMIGDADTDKSAIALNATQDPESIDIAMKAKAMAHEYEDTFIRGRTSTLSTTKQFKGLLLLLAELQAEGTVTLDGAGVNNSQVIAIDTGGDGLSGALTMAFLDQLIDQIKPGKPDMLLVSRRARRKINVLQRASGSGLVMTEPDKFGLKMPTYDGIPIYASDFLLDNFQNNAANILSPASYNPATTRTTNYDNTVIFALQLGEDKVTGLNAGEMKHEVIDPVETKNVRRNRFVWYCGAACFKKYSLAALIGVNPDS